MNTDKPGTALLIVVVVALVCSVLVSISTVGLRPIQERNALIERSRNIVALSGLVESSDAMSGEDVLAALEQMDTRVLHLEAAEFDPGIDPQEFNPRSAALDPELGTAIPPELDLAQLGRRSRFEVVYLAYEGDEVRRVILPIVGQGMWSTLYGYIALENDFSTIAAATFYEQAETAGIGDRITDPDWLSIWVGREIYANDGSYRFRIAPGPVDPGSTAATHAVDGISGATVTSTAVSRLMAYWFGPHGYGPFIEKLREETPQRLAAVARAES